MLEAWRWWVNKSKQRAFDRLAAQYPARHPRILTARKPPMEPTLRLSRIASGWGNVTSPDFLEPAPSGSWVELAMDILGRQDYDFANSILWNCTAFPCSDLKTTTEHLHQVRSWMDEGLNPFEEADRIMNEDLARYTSAVVP
jgi:hypothetical protein